MYGLTRGGQYITNWQQGFGCPIWHWGDYEAASGQMVRMLTKYKDDIFINTGGGPQFLPQRYRESIQPFKDAIQTGRLIIANIDTVPAQLEFLEEGISTVNVGQRPYEIGKWSVNILKMLTEGKKTPLIINTDLTFCNKDNIQTCMD